MKLKETIKIFSAIIGAFIIAQVSSKTIFMANTPRINKQFIASLSVPKSTGNNIFQRSIARKSNQNQRSSNPAFSQSAPINSIKNFQNIPISAMKQINKGAYAYEDAQSNIVYLKITNESEFEERIVMVDGKQITLRVPKGTFK